MKKSKGRPEGEYFPSRRDPLLGLLIWGPLLGIVPLTLLAARSGSILLVLMVLLAYGFVAWIWFGTGCTMGRYELIVRSGPMRWRIKYSEIDQIKVADTFLPSAALARDRLEIRFSKVGRLQISPREKQRFLERMRKRCPRTDIVAP